MSKARNLANLLADGAVGASELASTLDLSGKTMTLPAGVGGHASGNEASRPASPSIGTTYFNTDEDTLQQYTATGWKNIGGGVTTDSEANRPATPAVGTLFFNTTQDTLQQYTAQGWQDVGLEPFSISSVTGNIFTNTAGTLSISGSNFGASATVRFTVGATNYDVSVTPASSTSITVNVPNSVYAQAVGTSIPISVVQNGRTSNQINKSVIALPTGGTITSFNGYRYHTFLSSGTLNIPTGFNLDVEYLLIAGGGAGGTDNSGGGGAGGVLSGTYAVAPGSSYTFNIGSGAPANETVNTQSSSGLNTTGFSLTAIGGGRGGTGDEPQSLHNGGNGGSGGGGARETYIGIGGSGTSGQGFAGGNGGGTAGGGGGGGGGGAGGIGQAGGVRGDELGGNGGPGTGDYSEWASATSTGVSGFYAGGGAGGNQNDITPLGTGGSGGGGSSRLGFSGSATPANGVANTGSGGGGGTYGGGDCYGGGGGSGLVIVRYPF